MLVRRRGEAVRTTVLELFDLLSRWPGEGMGSSYGCPGWTDSNLFLAELHTFWVYTGNRIAYISFHGFPWTSMAVEVAMWKALPVWGSWV